MANYVFEENIRVYYHAAGIADDTLAAVTLAEITAAVEITDQLTKDGFAPGVSNNRVSIANLATSFDGEVMGSWGSQLTLTVLRNDVTADDVGFATLGTRGTQGDIIAVPVGSGTDGVPDTGDQCMVWRIETGTPEMPNSAANERQTATIPMAVSAANMNAEITAA